MARRDSPPLPDAPALAALAAALGDAGQWAEIVDCDWRYVHMTDELRIGLGGVVERARVPVGAHDFGTEAAVARREWRNGPKAPEQLRSALTALGGWLVSDTSGGRDELRRLVNPLCGTPSMGSPPGIHGWRWPTASAGLGSAVAKT